MKPLQAIISRIFPRVISFCCILIVISCHDKSRPNGFQEEECHQASQDQLSAFYEGGFIEKKHYQVLTYLDNHADSQSQLLRWTNDSTSKISVSTYLIPWFAQLFSEEVALSQYGIYLSNSRYQAFKRKIADSLRGIDILMLSTGDVFSTNKSLDFLSGVRCSDVKLLFSEEYGNTLYCELRYSLKYSSVQQMDIENPPIPYYGFAKNYLFIFDENDDICEFYESEGWYD